MPVFLSACLDAWLPAYLTELQNVCQSACMHVCLSDCWPKWGKLEVIMLNNNLEVDRHIMLPAKVRRCLEVSLDVFSDVSHTRLSVWHTLKLKGRSLWSQVCVCDVIALCAVCAVLMGYPSVRFSPGSLILSRKPLMPLSAFINLHSCTRQMCHSWL